MGISAGPSGVSDGLVFQLDAANFRSYSGSGNTANGLVSGIGGTLVIWMLLLKKLMFIEVLLLK